MALKVYGFSDDLIEFEGSEGDLYDETSPRGEDDEPTFVGLSDGTILSVLYRGMWQIRCLHKGPLFDRIEVGTDPDVDYSDKAFFHDGVKHAVVGLQHLGPARKER